MPYNVSRLTANGDILLNGTFDEVTLNSGSIRFNGSSSYLTVPDNATLNMGTSDFTVECWIYLTSTPSGYGTFILNKDGLENTSWPQYALFVNSQRNVCVSLSAAPFAGVSPTALLTGSTKISLGTWYHVAFTRSGTSGTLWINGVSDGTVTNVPANLTTRNAILVIGYEIRLSLTPSLIFSG